MSDLRGAKTWVDAHEQCPQVRSEVVWEAWMSNVNREAWEVLCSAARSRFSRLVAEAV
jgi:hypothetical protein